LGLAHCKTTIDFPAGSYLGLLSWVQLAMVLAAADWEARLPYLRASYPDWQFASQAVANDGRAILPTSG